jgi:hypothetical protein
MFFDFHGFVSVVKVPSIVLEVGKIALDVRNLSNVS